MKTFLLVLLLAVSHALFAQTDSLQRPYTLSILPVVYFTPETNWAFGGGAISNFTWGNDKSNTYESQLAVGGAYTLFNQFLSYGFWRVFSPQNKHKFSGEIGWYRYVYFYYGIGNAVQESDREAFNANLPRFKFNYLAQISPKWYGGFRYWFDDYQINEVKSAGLLETQAPLGSTGGRAAGFGPVFYFDSRDSQLYPKQGWYAEIVAQYFHPAFGGEFRFWQFTSDIRNIIPIAKNQVLVWNQYTELRAGEVPFFQLGLMGGNRLMRGLFEGKYRDYNMMMLQAEYRWKFAPRWGLVGFTGVGNVFSDQNAFQFSNTKLTYGSGVRFKLNSREKLNLRLDLAHAPGEDLRFYFTFGEAF